MGSSYSKKLLSNPWSGPQKDITNLIPCWYEQVILQLLLALFLNNSLAKPDREDLLMKNLGPQPQAPIHDEVLLRSQWVGFSTLRLYLGWTLESPLVGRRRKALRAENGTRMPYPSIMVVVIINLTLNFQSCSRPLLPHPTERSSSDGRQLGLRKPNGLPWGLQVREDIFLSLPPGINIERAKQAEESTEEKAGCSGLMWKMKKGSLRLTCGSTQHTSVGAQI